MKTEQLVNLNMSNKIFSILNNKYIISQKKFIYKFKLHSDWLKYANNSFNHILDDRYIVGEWNLTSL